MKACILGCESAVLSAAERAFFRETNPFGFILSPAIARTGSSCAVWSRICAPPSVAMRRF